MFQTLDFGPQLDVAARSAIGVGSRMRAENQDNFVLIDAGGRAAWLASGALQSRRLVGWPAGHVRLAVLDGMGGHGYGREAAESLAAALVSVPACRDVDTLSARLERLHHELQRRFDEFSGPRPGTTLTLLELPPDGPALLWHAGDSRLYEIKTTARPLTVDHVPATALALAGLVDKEEWWRQVHGAHTPQITQAFILGNTITDPAGISDALFAHTAENLPPWLSGLADRRALTLRPDTTYLLASDGFWSCFDPAEFVSRWPRLFEAGDAAAGLEALFGELEHNPPAGLQPDNLTAIVFRPRGLRRDDTALPGADSAGD